MVFLANVGPDLTGALGSGQGFSLWQTVGGLLAVFGLLMVSLKFLGKFQRQTGKGQASLLTVWNLGPRREIQVLRLEDEVHYIYRHDGAMVLLRKVPRTVWEAEAAQTESQESQTRGLLGKIFPGVRALSRGRTCDLGA